MADNPKDAAWYGVEDVEGDMDSLIAALNANDPAKYFARYRDDNELTFANDTGAIVIYQVTGDVIVRIVAVCKANVESVAAANIELGVAGATSAIIATTVATDIDAGDIWHDATPDSDIEALSVMKDFIIVEGADIILTLSDQVDSGEITFYCFWTPLSSDGVVEVLV